MVKLAVPNNLGYEPYQQEAIQQMLKRRNTLLADEMGLGKTIQAIGLINNMPGLNRILIICPASVKLQWLSELNKWLTKFYNIGIIYGLGAQDLDLKNKEVIITNFEIVNQHIEQFGKVNFDLKIIDEVQYISESGAKRTQAILSIKSKYNLFMGGTPADKPVKLWPALSYLVPEVFNSFEKYSFKFCGGHYDGRGLVSEGCTNPLYLEGLLRKHVMIRRLRKDVMSTQSIQRQLLPFDGYEAKIEESELIKKLPKDFDAAIKYLNGECPVYRVAEVRKKIGLSKVDLVSELLYSHIHDHKIVCFFYHREVGEKLNRIYKNSSVLVYGGVNTVTKEILKKRFMEDEKCRIYFGQVGAMGSGTDGLQSICWHGVFAEPDWSASVTEQCEGRLYRKGQTVPVLFQYPALNGSLDIYMIKKMLGKIKDKKSFLDGGRK